MAFITHKKAQQFQVKVYLGENSKRAEIFPNGVTVDVIAPTEHWAEEIAKQAIIEAVEDGLFLAKPVTELAEVWED